MRGAAKNLIRYGAAPAIVLGAFAVLYAQPATMDFNQAADWPGAPKRQTRDSNTQLMMIDRLSLDIPGQRAARNEATPPSVGTLFAAVWNALARGALVSSDRLSIVVPIWLAPLRGGGGQATQATRVHAYLTSLGNSTGEAFDIEIVNDGTTPVRIDGEGIVVQPIKSGSDRALRAELRQAASRSSGAVTSRANAYCLEFKLKPPERGSMFEVSDAATQEKFAPVREILRASHRLQDAGRLTPDSDPTDYFHSIRQWSIWVAEQRFTMSSYRTAFVERTKKNVEALGRKWSRDLENALVAYVPHRWDEITKILREAKQPVPGA
jgi:hypothetical protein